MYFVTYTFHSIIIEILFYFSFVTQKMPKGKAEINQSLILKENNGAFKIFMGIYNYNSFISSKIQQHLQMRKQQCQF